MIANRGDGAYRPREFGDSILVRRSISATARRARAPALPRTHPRLRRRAQRRACRAQGTPILKLLSHSGKAVAGGAAELRALCDHFQLDVKNPVNVMTQDLSRQFLADNKPSSRYEFFMGATQLETIQNGVADAGESLAAMEANLRRFEEDNQGVMDELRALEQEKEAFAAIAQQKKDKEDLEKRILWADVAVFEESLEVVKAKVVKGEQVLATQRAKVEAARAVKEKVDRDKAAAEAAAKGTTEEFDLASRAVAQKKAAFAAARKATADHELRLREAENEVERLRNRAAGMRNDKERAEAEGRTEADIELTQVSARVASARAEEEKRTAAVRAADDQGRQLARVKEEAQRELHLKTRAVETTSREIQEAEVELQRLRRQGEAPLTAFNPSMPAICEELKRRAHEFSQPPVGPLGAAVSLGDQRWARAVDECIGRALGTFLVATLKDSQLLQRIAGQVGARGVDVVVVGNLNPAPYNLLAPPQGQTTVMQALRLEGAPQAVINFLVDTGNIERTLLVDSSSTALALLDRRVADSFYCEDGTFVVEKNGSQNVLRCRTFTMPRLGVKVADAQQQVAARLEQLRLRKAQEQQAQRAAAVAADAAEAECKRGWNTLRALNLKAREAQSAFQMAEEESMRATQAAKPASSLPTPPLCA